MLTLGATHPSQAPLSPRAAIDQAATSRPPSPPSHTSKLHPMPPSPLFTCAVRPHTPHEMPLPPRLPVKSSCASAARRLCATSHPNPLAHPHATAAPPAACARRSCHPRADRATPADRSQTLHNQQHAIPRACACRGGLPFLFSRATTRSHPTCARLIAQSRGPMLRPPPQHAPQHCAPHAAAPPSPSRSRHSRRTDGTPSNPNCNPLSAAATRWRRATAPPLPPAPRAAGPPRWPQTARRRATSAAGPRAGSRR